MDESRSPETLPDVGCDDGPPKYLTEYSGASGENTETDEWYVPNRFYRMTEMKIFHNGSKTSGFHVKFQPYPLDQFPGWPELEHQFGSDALAVGNLATFLRDFVSIQVCFDGSGDENAFEGFRVLEYDDLASPRELNYGCLERYLYTLSNERVIGFKV